MFFLKSISGARCRCITSTAGAEALIGLSILTVVSSYTLNEAASTVLAVYAVVNI